MSQSSSPDFSPSVANARWALPGLIGSLTVSIVAWIFTFNPLVFVLPVAFLAAWIFLIYWNAANVRRLRRPAATDSPAPPFVNAPWVQPTLIGTVIAGVIFWIYTGSIMLLGLPFAFLFFWLILVDWKTAYYVLLFTIPFSIQIGLGSLSTSLPDEPMMWIFMGLFMVLVAHRPSIMPKWWFRDPFAFLIILQYVWIIVAVLFAERQLIAVKFLLAKTWFMTTFFLFPILIFQTKKDFKRAFFVMLVPITLTIIKIMYRHAQLGFNFRLIERAINGLYYNHVDYSTIISMFLPLIVVSLGFYRRDPKRFIVMLLLALFFLVATFLTYARAAMLGIVFAAAIGIAIRFRLVNLVLPTFYALVLGVVLWMGQHHRYFKFRPNFERTYMHHNFADHVAATFRGQDMSSMERFYRWIAGLRMVSDRPITGVGPNSFYYYYKSYTVNSFRTYVSRNMERSTTHNYFLYMLVEQGWPAMLLYAAVVIAFFYIAQKTYHRFRDPEYKLITLGIAMMYAACFINNFFSELIETHKVGALYYLCITLMIILNHKSKQEHPDGPTVSQ